MQVTAIEWTATRHADGAETPGFKPLLSNRFGTWTVISTVPIRRDREEFWLCRCDCGTTREVYSRNLVRGRSAGCGCSKAEAAAKKAAIIHGVTVEEWKRRKTIGEVWCYCCKAWLDQAEFRQDRSRGNRLRSVCNRCSAARSAASQYGVELEVVKLIRAEDRPCQICGRLAKLQIDHDHNTGRARGFLCGKCNKGIGMFNDDKELLIKALAYLEGVKCTVPQ